MGEKLAGGEPQPDMPCYVLADVFFRFGFWAEGLGVNGEPKTPYSKDQY